MLLMILVLIAAVVSFVVAKLWWCDMNDMKDFISTLCVILTGIFAVGLFIMVIVATVNNVGTEARIASNQQLYDSLVYQLENDVYDNDNDLGKKELYNQITDWNTDLATGKVMQHNPWLGIFYPNIYVEFEFIEFE